MINTELWIRVVRLRRANLTFAEISRVTGVSRQRAHQIVAQAKQYAAIHDNALARKILDLLMEGK